MIVKIIVVEVIEYLCNQVQPLQISLSGNQISKPFWKFESNLYVDVQCLYPVTNLRQSTKRIVTTIRFTGEFRKVL
jgi:hypothetical protein